MGWTDRENAVDGMKEIIQREIQSIDSLKERVAFKELMEGVFLSLYETNLQMYEELEQRIKEETDYDADGFHIKTGIVEREYFDASHHLFSPIAEEDAAEKSYDMKEILTAVKEDGAFPLMKVMLYCDYLEIQRLWENPPVFEGLIETDEPLQEWKIEVRLRENKGYLDRIAYLYHLFVKNGIPWQTVNAPYLYKMADVVVTGLPEEITGNERIRQVTVRFGDYSRIVKEDVIPVWNIQKLVMESIGFPVPCEDHVSFEHIISLHEHGAGNAYLADDDREIRSISQAGERLRIISGASEAKKWNIYCIRASKEQKIDRYTYPVLGNRRAGSFAEKYQAKWNQSIRTKTQLMHFIKGFGLEDYVQYQDCRVAGEFPGKKETYSMNPFITDELRNREAQDKLVLFFRSGQKEAWLQRDILSFLTSEVQRIYPEYDCGGVLV